MSQRPAISIVLEGFNESRERGASDNTIGALRQQDYPLDEVELILVGSTHQAEEWAPLCQNPLPFRAVKAVVADGASYYELKNRGAQEAEGEIVAFTDSDVFPEPTWISSIVKNIRGGADVSVGVSLFQDSGKWTARSIFRQMAVSCSFGFVLGPISESGVEVRGFMDHNVAMKSSVLDTMRYRTDLGRVLASPLLFRDLKLSGLQVRLIGGQAVVHYFGWFYWMYKLQFRYGFEVFRLRRIDPHYPNQWIRRFGVLEPLATMAWHSMLDVPRWFRFCHVRGIAQPVAWLMLPCLVTISVFGRGAEMLGMYSTMLWPEPMARWAETV